MTCRSAPFWIPDDEDDEEDEDEDEEEEEDAGGQQDGALLTRALFEVAGLLLLGVEDADSDLNRNMTTIVQ